MTACEKFQEDLLALLAEEPAAGQKAQLEKHAQNCAACAAEMSEMRAVWKTLDVWHEQTIPAAVTLSVREQARLLQPATSEERLVVRLRKLFVQNPVRAFGLGLLTAIIATIILSLRIDFSLIHPLGLVIAGALWTALFGLVYYMLTVEREPSGLSWKLPAQVALVAIGLFIAFTCLNPMPCSVQYCSTQGPAQTFWSSLSPETAYCIFGGFYAMLPMTIASYFSAKKHARQNQILRRGSLAAVMFTFLLAPSIYLQCTPFALGLLIGWFSGALVGAVIGGTVGYWVRYKLA